MASIWDWSKTASSNTTADSDINWQEGQNANTVNNSARAMMGRTAELLDDLGGLVTVSGTNSLTCTTNSAFTALANGLLFAFTAANDNTDVVTLAPNSLTAKKLIKFTSSGETELAAGDLKAGGKYLVIYSSAADSGTGAWVLLNLAPPDISTYMRGLLDDADEATFKASVNLEIGTDVQAYRAELALVNLSGSNIASATTTDLSTATGDFVGITLTNTIVSFGTAPAGTERVLVFAASLQITHNATSMILPGGANITTAAGDAAVMRSLGSGNWRCIVYTRADGTPINANLSAIGNLTSAADKVPYFTGSGAAAVADFTASGRDLVAQDIDTDEYVYGDGVGSWAVGTLTSAGRALLDDADAAAQRATLGVKAQSEKAAFSAHKNGSDQSITGGSPVKATFGTELFDVGSYYDTSTSRWTPPAGKHVINASVDYEAATDNQIVAVYLYKNGSPFRWKVHRAAGTGSQSASLTALVDANGTDYYEVYALNFASTNIQGETTFTFFEGWEL